VHKHLDLFSGIGGFSLGLEATGGFETVAFCDYEPFCQKVLRKHWEEVPIYKDVKELTYEKLKTDGIDKIDIITGGYPCQPFSVAGSKKGEQDPRHVWPEMFRLVKECRPTWVIGENVGGHIKLGLDTVLENLESEGYSARTFSISASSIGANHQRERVWIIANKNVEDSRSHSGGIQFTRDQESFGSRSSETSEWSTNTNKTTGSSKRTEAMADTNSERQQEQRRSQSVSKRRNEFERSSGEAWNEWWEVEPNVGRVVDGLPKRVDRLKSLGNSVVPHIPYYIGQSIIKSGEIK